MSGPIVREHDILWDTDLIFLDNSRWNTARPNILYNDKGMVSEITPNIL